MDFWVHDPPEYRITRGVLTSFIYRRRRNSPGGSMCSDGMKYPSERYLEERRVAPYVRSCRVYLCILSKGAHSLITTPRSRSAMKNARYSDSDPSAHLAIQI